MKWKLLFAVVPVLIVGFGPFAQAAESRSPEWYWDVAIGEGRTGFEDASIGFDTPSGNIFALIQWADGWSMNISTDRGVSFSETYFWPGDSLADMDVVGDHAWVGYAPNGIAGSVRMRRFHVADGTVDGAYGWVEVNNVSPDFIHDLVVESNAPDNNDRIYLVHTDSGTGTVDLWWDDLNGTSFALLPTGISYAWYGLDFAWNPFAANPNEGNFWISFIDSTPNVNIYTNTAATFNRESFQSFTGTRRDTGISAYADNVYSVYEKDNGTGQNGVAYLRTSNAGGSWFVGNAFVPSAGGATSTHPNVSLRSGAVPAVVFTSDVATVDKTWHTQRSALASGPWEAPSQFSNYDAAPGSPIEIEWLDVLCVQSHGMVYGDDEGVPYFDLTIPRCLFSDGFE